MDKDSEHPEGGMRPIGSEGPQIKRQIADDKREDKDEEFDYGASMLGTDNEAGSAPDHEGMAEARKASKPAGG